MQTRVLVTHRVNILPQVDSIVLLVDGTVAEVGSYQKLLQRNGPFAEFLHSHIAAEEKAGNVFPGNKRVAIILPRSSSQLFP